MMMMTMIIRTKRNSRVKFTSFSGKLNHAASKPNALLLTFDHLALGSTLSIFLERNRRWKGKHN